MACSKRAGRSCCWAGSIRRPLHRANVRVQECMAGQKRILLRLRLLECGQHHSYHYDQRSNYYCHLHPAVLRGKLAHALRSPSEFWLTSQNYHWWWQSFFVGGGSAFWVFVYCIWYYATRLHIQGFISSMLFFSYSFLTCIVYGLLSGTVGFLTAYAFVRRLYR